ncbi:MAG: L,D-transpeptidase [Coriobacteriia bacterium]|nr:L,D-transpeptidase [Coriobacteriia bacterium]
MTTRRSLRLVALVVCASFVLAVAPLPVSATMALPDAPTISNPNNQLTRDGNVVISGTLDGNTDELRFVTPTQDTTMAVSSGATTYTATVSIPVAREASLITVTPSNAAGPGLPAVLSAFNLGAVPGYATFVLVDKYDFTLYVITNDVVGFQRPVAIGMPGAQTPTGTWILGPGQRMRPSTTSWGVMRLPLMRYQTRHVRVRVRARVRGHVRWVRRWKHRRVLVKTSYYIHGTNDPDSIGTMASHGCIRMYNADVVTFSTLVGRWPVVIRN